MGRDRPPGQHERRARVPQTIITAVIALLVLTVRAASARAVSRSIEAWARERGVVVRERMRTSMRVRIQPRAPRVAVTG